jgi:hypothetical protein
MMSDQLPGSLTQRLIPTRHPSWADLATRTGGILKRNKFWRSDEVVSSMGGWEVHLQSVMLDHKTGARNPGTLYSTRRGTEVWAGFSSLDGFRFSARDRQWLRRQPYQLQWDVDVGRLVDAVRRRRQPEDTQIGNETFDQRFVTRSNDPGKLRALLEGSALDRILKRPCLAEFHIEAAEPDESGSPQPASLVVWEREMLLDADQLLDLHEVLLSLLDRLGRLGSAGPLTGPA